MSLNYTELQAEIVAHLARGDLTARIPGFITRGENYLNSKLKLITMESLSEFPLAVSTRSVTYSQIINKIREIKRIWRPDNDRYCEVDKVDGLKLMQLGTTQAGYPRYWNSQGSESIYFDRPADQAYTLTAHVVAGFDIATTSNNWVSTNHEELYLYASLKQAEPYLKKDSRIATWAALLEEAITAVNAEDESRRGDAENILMPETAVYMGGRRGYNITSDE